MIVGYEFLVNVNNQNFWTAIRGNGGKVGNGCLHVQDRDFSQNLLLRVKSELKRNGYLYLHRETPNSPFRFESVKTEVQNVLDCRPVYCD